ncbi:MAG: hypothetical protein KC486_02990 [Myxococcales bacterium]|nr:hypothetical protein [Myxococcales bacterium]
MTNLGIFQRTFVSAMRMMARLSAGYDMGPIAEEMVRTHGVRGTMRLMKFGAEVTETLSKAVGDYTAQTLIGIAALWNGCRYCVIGHIYSANLHRFEKEGALGPFDEHDLIDLMYMTDDESYEAIKATLSGPEDAATWHLVDRMFKLRFQDIDPAEGEDELLKATLAYWEWLNECTIILGVDATPGNVPALGYMRPSAELVAKYAQAREEARAKKLESSVH